MATRRRRSKRLTIQRPPSLLILHLDAEKLRADGLLLTDITSFIGIVASLASGATVVTKKTTTLRDLLDELGELLRDGHQFDVVVAIGHSNENGIKAASDAELMTWAAFAGYLKPFKPKRLMLVACQAGRWPAADVLFTKLGTLRRIFASPVNASKELATLMIALVPYLVEVKAPSNAMVAKAQGWAMALTGRQVRHWMKKDKDNPEGHLSRPLDERAVLLVRVRAEMEMMDTPVEEHAVLVERLRSRLAQVWPQVVPILDLRAEGVEPRTQVRGHDEGCRRVNVAGAWLDEPSAGTEVDDV